MPLNESQKADMFRKLVAAGFSPTDFSWGQYETLHYRGPRNEKVAGYRFTAELPRSQTFGYDRRPRLGMSPGEHELTEAVFCGPEEVMKHFDRWVRFLKRETETPDLWAEAAKLATALAKVPQGDDATKVPFSNEERLLLFKAIEAVEMEVAGLPNVDEAQREAMRETVAEAKEATEIFPRHWLLRAVVTAIVGQVVKGGLTLHNAEWLYIRLVHALQTVVGLGGDAIVRHLDGT
jgi:hypothetical protein